MQRSSRELLRRDWEDLRNGACIPNRCCSVIRGLHGLAATRSSASTSPPSGTVAGEGKPAPSRPASAPSDYLPYYVPSRTHHQTDGYLNEYQANLEQLMDAFPEAQLLGLDLSGAYLREANRRLSQAAGILPQLLKGNERGGHALCIKQHAGCDQRVLAP